MTFYLKSNGANNRFGSKSENTSDKVVFCGMIISTFFFLPPHTWKLSSRSIKGLLTVYSCSFCISLTIIFIDDYMRSSNVPPQNVSKYHKKLQLCIFISCSLTICSFIYTAIAAACNSKRGIARCLVSATLHFAKTTAKSAESSHGKEHRQTNAHIVSSDAWANTWK